jgi:hydroxymethylglutaryl-CoA lyase
MSKKDVQLVECPRDAIQGITHFISTEKKIAYINSLISSGLFAYIDCGSFVSPKAVPQMADTEALLAGIDKENDTKLLAIVANERGAEIGVRQEKLDFLGYPFSISETFQQRNANSTIDQSYRRIQNISDILSSSEKELVVYISMAFGNPYGDVWSEELVLEWVGKLSVLGIRRFSIADTTSMAFPQQIENLFTSIKATFPHIDLSAHFHSRVENALLKVEAAYRAGCRKFEGALLGFGGCPFAQDELVGNMPMELLLDYFKGIKPPEIVNLLDSFQELIRNEDGL